MGIRTEKKAAENKALWEHLPASSGIYIMKDKDGQILYIGKARSLRKRVQSYFRSRSHEPKIEALLKQVASIDYVETQTEVDALLLEAQMVQRHLPKYNKELKDDKSYPLLKITHETFPRIHLTRSRSDKRAIYYGPYTDAKLLREAVTLINTLFPLRKCRRLPKTACLYYHIGQCLAPCIRSDIKEAYQQLVDEVKEFLKGGKKSFVEYLTERMEEAARELRFEDAQYFKEQIEALSRLKARKFSVPKGEATIALSASLELKKVLKMEKVPEKIVCFDVSNIQGAYAVASKVSFYRELPDKLHYRRYRIKAVRGIDDYAMIQEALRRMLCGIREGRETFLPDLVVIDGGRGHLSKAVQVIEEEGFHGLALIAIAKRFETVYSHRTLQPVFFDKRSPALYLIQKIRDEAHRFAISYHRHLKEKAMLQSLLDKIPKIGPRRKRLLLQHFESLDELKRAGVVQLAGLPGMDIQAARNVWNYFHASSNFALEHSA